MSTELERWVPSPEDIKHQELLGSLDANIEDHEFALQLAQAGQNLIHPVQMAKHLYDKWQQAGGSLENDWYKVLWQYLNGLNIQEFDSDQTQRLNQLVRQLQEDTITGAPLDETEIIDLSVGELGEDEWLWEKFDTGLSQAEFDRIWSLSAFRPIKALIVSSGGFIRDIKFAFQFIGKAGEEEAAEMRQLLDRFVFKTAEGYADGTINGLRNLPDAINTIEAYGSTAAAKAKMRASLDKHVFAEAERLAADNIYEAEEFIFTFASPARRDTMLRRLDLA